ncbi:helix-turn-helix transcriptional regulator [Cytobacillus sp. S13-E01]|uniref:helix-turn-helix domain-containing protein n=1 Tax=Cytobacillus sp. S13-E01 TaxID=3031326 RepID=UPI0023D80605|nr:helix-turn-helix transcriptional regulator [Cytobacillus sp. S13-E01]MDF0728009.1 helix-turn-helix transcriptional regulator [Cytobacillus sp. S13-E01]
MTKYTAKKSNLKEILLKNNTNIEALEKNTQIPKSQLNDYMSKKVMNVNTAMTISKELNCQIEDLYVWKTAE